MYSRSVLAQVEVKVHKCVYTVNAGWKSSKVSKKTRKVVRARGGLVGEVERKVF